VGTNGQSGDTAGGVRHLVARVVPDVPSFSVDTGFRYRVPEQLSVEVGSVVRVPLGPRRVRGWVVNVTEESTEGLKEIRQVSGDRAIFNEPLLVSQRWAAQHYVTPLSTLLAKSGPPNLPRTLKKREHPAVHPDLPPGVLFDAASAIAAGHRQPVTAFVSSRRDLGVEGVVAANRSVMLVAASAVEAVETADSLSHLGSRVILVDPEMSDRAITTAWTRAITEQGVVLVGTERVAWWPVADLALAVILDDGRRGMKARQTPTLHVREVLLSRAKVERFTLASVSRVPTTEMLGAGARLITDTRRSWSLVEIVDRTEEPPGGGVVTDRVRAALRGLVANNQRAFVFTHRRGFAPAFRCIRCRTLRLCRECGSRATNQSVCPRCASDLGPCLECMGRQFEPLGAAVGRVVEELGRAVGSEHVGTIEQGRAVSVGTERDLVGMSGVDLAVAVDADGLVFGTNYRSTEDALRLLARVAGAVGEGRGRRTMVQTSQPHHPVLAALRRGDPSEFLENELRERRRLGFPPFGEVMVIEVGNAPQWAGERVAGAVSAPALALGPVDAFGRVRWLVQGADLAATREALKAVVQELRDANAQVRIDVDPLDF